ncbi:hypothetical protein LTR99_003457 [Exophiala xenobiotica]|uniref:GFO/IDH/MocA-like oxidoreductase domain-containing protein n=1 Tax=Vermiconidia calcicola TaxID=1690605 RepID=A0AAV9PY12_9PEZI|nr:hypothetical protein LTR92_009280 [Exophiala xenobiotica]KAK5529171.1 hypothetical protein LTR25_009908 [Vermiconidia calcicola]KAK5547136.1 hypothetical protein LTR23_002775 [Chaetothyriales sp. CCFEE 6169]KAK5266388.1 hypothetical protein LTR96_008235 [Exophiala xenobiotica]KAK5305912.1 hypothetical protein LTR99_003457 [Exophiala xenobiotica]
MDLASPGPDSGLKDPALGAGSCFDIGIYPLTWALLTLDAHVRRPKIAAVQTTRDGIDVASSMLLIYSSGAEQAIPSSTTEAKTDEGFCRIEGTAGYIDSARYRASRYIRRMSHWTKD